MSLQVSDKPIDPVGTNVESKIDNNPINTADGFVVIDKQTNNLGSSTNSMNRIMHRTEYQSRQRLNYAT